MGQLTVAQVRPLTRFRHGGHFTQGLLVYGDGLVLESVGEYGRSRLLYRSGSDLAEVAVHPFAKSFFAEDICPAGDGRVIVLSYREQTTLVWNVTSAAVEQTLEYDREGWGICHTGQYLTSDGTNTLVRRARDLTPVSTLEVTLAGEPLAGLNALGGSAGTVWANIYGVDYLAAIDPDSGGVHTLVDASALRDDERPDAGVLNGVCQYRPGSLLLTWKRWDWMYEVALEPVPWSAAHLDQVLRGMPRYFYATERPQRLVTRATSRAQGAA